MRRNSSVRRSDNRREFPCVDRCRPPPRPRRPACFSPSSPLPTKGPRAPTSGSASGFIGTGGRCQAHIDIVLALKAQGRCEPVAVCDVYGPRVAGGGREDRRQDLSQPQGTAGRSARRRGVHRHARPPSRPAGHRRDPRRQGRLLREAADALVADGPGPAGRRGGGEAQADRAGGHAVRGRRRLRQGPQADRRRGSWARSSTCRPAISAAATGASGCPSPTPTPSPAPISTGSSSSATPRRRHFDVSRFFQWRLYWDYAGGPATDLLVHVFTPVFCLLGPGLPRARPGRRRHLPVQPRSARPVQHHRRLRRRAERGADELAEQLHAASTRSFAAPTA